MNKSSFKTISLIFAACMFLMCAGSCKKHGPHGDFPDDFQSMTDTEKVKYVIANTTPDSVARFICDASLGNIPGVTLDSVGIVTLYVYDYYRSNDDIDKFSIEFDKYPNTLPLEQKMKFLYKAGTLDPTQIGYELGLSYVSQIRDQHKTADDVEKEIKAFKDACKSDPETYRRFLQGFKISLEADRGKDLPEDVYRRFINFY